MLRHTDAMCRNYPPNSPLIPHSSRPHPENASFSKHASQQPETLDEAAVVGSNVHISPLIRRLKNILHAASNAPQHQQHNFDLGMHTQDGEKSRHQWLALEKELHHAQGIAQWSLHRTNTKAHQHLLQALSHFIAQASVSLVRNHNLPVPSSEKSTSISFCIHLATSSF